MVAVGSTHCCCATGHPPSHCGLEPTPVPEASEHKLHTKKRMIFYWDVYQFAKTCKNTEWYWSSNCLWCCEKGFYIWRNLGDNQPVADGMQFMSFSMSLNRFWRQVWNLPKTHQTWTNPKLARKPQNHQSSEVHINPWMSRWRLTNTPSTGDTNHFRASWAMRSSMAGFCFPIPRDSAQNSFWSEGLIA